VELLNALSAENSQVVAAIKMLYTIAMVFAEFLLQGFFVLLLEFKIGLG